MSQDLQAMFHVTKKLQESLAEINKFLVTHLQNNKSEEKNLSRKKPQNNVKNENKKIKTQIDKQKQKKDETKKQKKSPLANDKEGSQKIQKVKIERPKKPKSAFFLFVNSKKQFIKKQYPKKSNSEISEILGKVWSQLQEEEKKPYCQDYQKEKLKYARQMDLFLRQNPQKQTKKYKKQRKKQEKEIQRKDKIKVEKTIQNDSSEEDDDEEKLIKMFNTAKKQESLA